MTSKLLLSTLATASLILGAPAYSADGKDHADDKAQVKCDPAKDKDCKEHKADEKDHKAGDGHKEEKK